MEGNPLVKPFTFLLIVLALCKSGDASCTVAARELDNSDKHNIEEGRILGYTCQTGHGFDDGSAMVTSYCRDGQWTELTASCVADNTPPTCEGDPTTPSNTDPVTSVASLSNDAARIFACQEDKKWLSGYTHQFSVCKNTGWSKIADMCDAACEAPKDCSDVYDLGLKNSGAYKVIPSGMSADSAQTVYCDMPGSDADQDPMKWTKILKVTSGQDVDWTSDMYKKSTGNLETANTEADYFVGLNYLSQLSANSMDDPLILQVDFMDSQGAVIERATFSNFSIGAAPDYPLVSVGTYHGNAGNGLCPLVGMPFEFGDDAAGPRWWGSAEDSEFINLMNASFVTKFLWASKDMTNIKTIEMKIRRTSVETALCPPLVGSESYWTTTDTVIPFDRTVGTAIEYKCTESYMYEGEIDAELEQKTKGGIIKCLDGENGGKPKWDTEVVLPCAIHCPAEFTMSSDGSQCYHASGATEKGYLSAAKECKKMNATLASSAAVETTMDVGIEYFVLESTWGTEVSALTPNFLDQNYTSCESPSICERSEEQECMVVTSEFKHNFTTCDSELKYLCQYPGLCPEGYTLVGSSSCYKVVDQGGNFAKAAQACASSGGTPANPVTLEEFNIMKKFLFEDDSLQGLKVLIGNNKVDLTWTSNGLYEAPKDDLLELLNDTAEDAWRYIEVGADQIFTDSTQEATTKVICQYPGPIGCDSPPPVPLENMNDPVITSENNVGSVATYTCHSGYFLDPATGTAEQEQECLAALGQWVNTVSPYGTSLLECERHKVCDPEIEFPESMTKTDDDDSPYMGGTILMACIEGLSLLNGSTSFNLTCGKNASGGFSYLPGEMPACERCIEELKDVENAVLISYNPTKPYKIDETVEVKCNNHYEYAFENTSRMIKCSSEGWINDNTPCYKVCQKPTMPTENIEIVEYTDNKVGAEVTYKCPDGTFFEKLSPTDELVSEFKIKCQDDMTWEALPVTDTLKCSAPPCPDGFTQSSNENCYMFENEEKASGFLDANKKCWTKGASLATTSALTLMEDKGVDGGSYFVAETKRASGATEYVPTIDSTISCPDGGCSDDETHLCTKLNKDKTYDHVSCSESLSYICQYPGYCPDEYTMVKGRCYKVIESSGTDALETCAKDGSSLANPVTKDQFNDMAATLYPTTEAEEILLTGLNNVDGTWTSGGLFEEPDSDMLQMLGEGQPWRALKVSPPDTYTLMAVDISSDTVTKSICMHNGPVECSENAPDAKENMEITEDGEVSKFAGTVVEYKCSHGYFVGGNTSVTTQKLTCLGPAGGWYPGELKECTRVEVCPTIPEAPSTLVTIGTDADSKYLGGVVTFKCADNMTTSTFEDSSTTTCTETSGSFSFTTTTVNDCNVCAGEIPSVDNVTLEDYDESTPYTIDTTIVAKCADSLEFLGIGDSTNISCTDKGWNFTHTGGCFPVCPKTLPDAGDNVTIPDIFTNGINDTVEYNCTEGLHFVMNEDYTEATQTVKVICESDQTWNTPRQLEDLKCVSLCPMDPPNAPENANTTWDNSSRLLGHEINYTCTDGYAFGTNEPLWTMTCNGTAWDPPLDDNFTCFIITTTTPPPTTPYLARAADAEFYSETTDYYEPDMSKMTDINGADPKTLPAPVPFDNGVSLVSEEGNCLIRNITDPCLANPGHPDCALGLSFSIWARITPQNESSDERRYLVSTGGDENGHPGIAIYEQGSYLVGLVSLGESYWMTKSFHHMPYDEWTVVGIRWSSDEDKGIELFHLMKEEGMMKTHAIKKQPTAASGDIAKLGLIPSQLIIGCHKDQTNQEYRHFITADLDEFAVWRKFVDESETKWFIGGYRASTWTAEDAIRAFDQVDLTNTNTYQQIISNVLISAEKNKVEKENAVAIETSTEVSTSTAESTTDSVVNITVNEEDIKDMNSSLSVVMKMTDLETCPKTVGAADIQGYLNIHKLFGGSMDPSPTTTKTWEKIVAEEPQKEILAMTDRVNNFIFCALQKVSLTEEEPSFQKASMTDNAVILTSKKRLGDIINQKQVVLPDPMTELPESFNKISKAAFSPKQFNDRRCENRTFSTSIGIYNNMNSMAPLNVNEAEFEEEVFLAVDSYVMTVHMAIDDEHFEDGLKDTSQPGCGLGTQEGNNIALEIHHKASKPAIPRRRVLADESSGFFEPEIDSNILERYCAWRNPDLGATGVWEISKCKLVRTGSESTTCLCRNQGTYAILSQIREPKIVAEEPYWLWLTKNILYGLSIVCIILYLLAVAFSGDLKDQFHLAGANLAVALLVGTIAMILSDQEFVRESRDFCGAISTMIFYFYLAAGAWCLAIGHICFKAITAGVISGKLNTYMCMTWGFSLTMVGIVYMFFLYDVGTDPRCFVAWENDVKICLFFPQIILSLGGLFYSCVIFCNLSTPALRKDNLIDDYCSFCRGTAAMLVLFATTWIFGLLAYVRMGVTLDFYPAFTIFNSAMGIILLILIGFGSNRFRTVLTGQAKKRRDMLRKNAFGLPGLKRGYNRNKTNVSQIPSIPTPEEQ